MRMIDIQGLRDWSAQRGLFWHEEWPQRPAFGPDPVKIAWPWPRPHGWTRPWQLAEFLLASVRAVSLGEPGGWYLWPRNGRWTARGSQPYYRVRNALLGGIGIHTGDQGAAFFEGSEGDDGAGLAKALQAFGFPLLDCRKGFDSLPGERCVAWKGDCLPLYESDEYHKPVGEHVQAHANPAYWPPEVVVRVRRIEE